MRALEKPVEVDSKPLKKKVVRGSNPLTQTKSKAGSIQTEALPALFYILYSSFSMTMFQ
jgi:hypothetical protein